MKLERSTGKECYDCLSDTKKKKKVPPSELVFVPLVSVDNMMDIVNLIGVPKIMAEMAVYIEEDFLR